MKSINFWFLYTLVDWLYVHFIKINKHKIGLAKRQVFQIFRSFSVFSSFSLNTLDHYNGICVN